LDTEKSEKLSSEEEEIVEKTTEVSHPPGLAYSDVVLGYGPWSFVVFKDKITVLDPVLRLEGLPV